MRSACWTFGLSTRCSPQSTLLFRSAIVPFALVFVRTAFSRRGQNPSRPKHTWEEAKEDERDFVGALESGGPTQHRGTWARKDMPKPRLEALCACWHALIARALTGSDTRG